MKKENSLNKKKKAKNHKAVEQSQSEGKVLKSKILRILVFSVGFISFVLGTIGIFLPVLPTTPLYLLASYCFVRSSARFNRWFLNSKLYKKHVENFAVTRSMIYDNEVLLLVGVSAILLFTIFLVNKLPVTIILTILIFIKYAYFIFKVKPISRNEFNKMQKERAFRKIVQEEIRRVKENAR